MPHRPITAIELNGIEPGGTPRALPIFEWMDPAALLVDEGYQRESSERSLKLVRKIVSGWDWARFKPPVGVITSDGVELLDGQHTAIAAATHPDVDVIPVMIVDVPERTERAGAFIGHNRDRVAVTTIQLHVAALAAGDADALAIQRICDHAGVTIVRASNGAGKFEAGQTMAVGALGALIREWGEPHAVIVLDTLGRTSLAPIGAAHIKAANMLLTEKDYSDQINKEQIIAVIEAMGPKADQEAAVFRAAHPATPAWKALGITWFRNRRVKPGQQKAPEIDRNSVTSSPVVADIPRPSASISAIKRPAPPVADNGKRDVRPKLNGWVPGVFLLRCSSCDEKYQGDRKSRQCADCAYGSAQAVSA